MPAACRKATGLVTLAIALCRDMTLNTLRMLPGRE